MAEKPLLLSANNIHVEECGEPPTWAVARVPKHRRFYGENCHGEQIVALAGYEGVKFAGGDLGWENEKVISRDLCLMAKEGGYSQAAVRNATLLVLNREECLLLAAAFECCCTMPAPEPEST
jgi:hypothetical protein